MSQYHRLKHETSFIVKGAIEMKVDEDGRFQMRQDDKYVIDRKRRYELTSLKNSLILESSTPDLSDDSLFDESQITVMKQFSAELAPDLEDYGSNFNRK